MNTTNGAATPVVDSGGDTTTAKPARKRGAPGANYSATFRLKLTKANGTLARVTAVIAENGGDIDAIDIVKSTDGFVIRDITVDLSDGDHACELADKFRAMDGVEVVSVSDRTFRLHLGGKLTVNPRSPIETRDDLSMIYTPGVARVCLAIAADPSLAHTLTIKRNTVAVISNGTRVLALGDIGPYGAMPVMEGKAALFKRFAGVDAFPICLDTKDTETIIATIKAIAPAFGGINLEDIKSPECYEIERRLQAELDIPVVHDDQHGTAVVVLAAAINAARLTRKQLRNLKVVASGVGAAGMACIKLLMAAGVRNVIGFNIGGAVHVGRTDLTEEERWLAEHSNKRQFKGTLKEALVGADMFLGLSAGNILEASDLAVMRRDPIVFALANPVPEVNPHEATKYAAVVATGASNFPNQVNNALVFPGMFRGLLDCRVRDLTDEMQIEAARAIAGIIPRDELHADYIIPGVFNPAVSKAVAEAVCRVAVRTGAARRVPKS